MKKRLLYLRPFRSSPDSQVVVALARTVAKIGKIVLIGPTADRLALGSYWNAQGRDVPSIDNAIQYVECASSEWKRTVHREIDAADCIFLYLAPKVKRFPFRRKISLSLPRIEKYYNAPFRDISTGAGLLSEVAYLDRLGKIGNTVVVYHEHESGYIRELISRASVDVTFFVRTKDGMRAFSPRLLALDRQLARLKTAASMVGFSEGDLDTPGSLFDRNVKRSIKIALRHQDSLKHVPRPSWSDLTGVSPTPRLLPPDNQLKIISHTNVEDLLHIPPGEISEVAADQARSRLSRRANRKGCPNCKAGLLKFFFYTNGLETNPAAVIRIKCQNCMAYFLIEDQELWEA